MPDVRTITATPRMVAQCLAAADQPGRTLTGLVVPYGPTGNTSAGPLSVEAGAIELPDDLRRIKLVDEHRHPPQPIGYATDAEATDHGLRMTFKVGRTPAGDAALLEASEGVRDAFSVELNGVTVDAENTITAARLTAVALVTVPAYSDALVDGIAASHNQPEGETTMPETNTDTAAPVEAGEADETTEAAAPAPVEAAAMPDQLHRRRETVGRTLDEFYAAQARVHAGVSRPEVEAALSDITNTANIWVARDDYAGQLWDGLAYSRRFVPLMQSGTLRSYKGTGWRWVVKPAVDDYAGDKADVPSNAPSTEAVEYTAARLAGAHDLDRKFWDFGDREFIAAYYEAMRESYAAQSDAKAEAFLIANATAGPAVTGGLLDAAVMAADVLDENTNGAPLSYVLVNPADRRTMLGTTASDMPAFLAAFGIDPGRFIASASVPAGTVIAGTRAASTFYELPGSPIRVETVSITNGGIDGGLFGYYATLLNHAAGIVSVSFTAPA